MTPLRLVGALLLALVSVPGCAEQPDPVRYGTRRVYVDTGCPEPHRTWAAEAVPRLGALGREAWEVVAIPAAADVTVRCRVFPSCAEDPARCGAAGSFSPGDRFVEFDTERTRVSFDVHAVVEHELIHHRVYEGPHPERAAFHVCKLVNELPSGCYDGWHGEAVMNPAAISDGRPGGWDDVVGTLSLDEIQPGDVEFYRWALTP